MRETCPGKITDIRTGSYAREDSDVVCNELRMTNDRSFASRAGSDEKPSLTEAIHTLKEGSLPT